MHASDNYTLIVALAIGIAASALTIFSAVARVSKNKYLCDDCQFNSAADCLKPERPCAVMCTSYRHAGDEEQKQSTAS